MAITLDDVVLEQMQTNEQLQIMHKTDLAAFAIERQGFRDLIEKQEDLISVITAETLRQSRSDRERSREESDSGGNGGDGGGNTPDDFRSAVGGAAAGGIGKGIGSVASLAGLAAGIVAFVGTLAAGGALVKMMGIDFNGLKHMLVGVADAFAAADTFGLIKMAGFLALGGLAKLDAVNAGLFGASMAAFMLGLGAGGKILDVLGFDFSGLKNVLVSFADAFKAASTEGLIKMAGFLAVGAYVKGSPADALKFGASIAAFMLGLGAGGAIMDFFGMDFTGLKNVLVGLGEAFAQMPAEGYIMLGVMAAATAMVGPSTMAKAGLGIAAFIAPLGIVGALLGRMGGGDGFGSLMKNIGEGLAAFGNVRTLAAMLVFGAVAAIPGGFAVLGLAGAGIALFLLALGGASVVLKTLGADGSGIRTLMENISAGIDSFSQINFKNLLLMGPAMASVAMGLAAFMAGSLVAGIGNFVKKLFGGGRDKSSIQIIAEDLAHLNDIDFKNLVGMGPVAIAIDKMADAIEKLNEVMDDIDDDLFERLKEMLSGASFTVASQSPVRTFTGRQTSEPRTQLAVESTSSSSSRDTLTDAQRARVDEIDAMSRAEYRQLSNYDKAEYRIMKAQKQKEDGQDAAGLGLVPSESRRTARPTSSNPQDEREMEVAELGVTFRNAEEARKAFEASDASFETFVDPDDFFGDEQRRYTDPAMQAKYEALLQAERDARYAYSEKRSDLLSDGDRNVDSHHKVVFLQERGLLPKNFTRTFRMGELDRMIDEYFENLRAGEEVQRTKPKPVPMVAKKQASIPSDSVGDETGDERLVRANSDEDELERLRRRNKGTYDIYVPSYEDFRNNRDKVSYQDFNRFGGDYEKFRDYKEESLRRNNSDFVEREDRIKILEGRINASKPQPVVKKAPIDTAATDFVQRDAMANVANSQVAPNVVIQDNSVNSSSQTSTTVSNKPPMPSPLNNNRTRANAYAMV